jgi:hypothetical protein
MNTERIEDRIERLQTYVDEGRILRGSWTGTDARGRETACLLAALSPEVGEEERASACPAHVMPGWLARLTPMLDDETSEGYWPEFVRAYASAAARWHVLDAAAWRRVLGRVMLATLEIARPHGRAGAVARVADLWSRVLDGDEPTGSEWAAARAAASAWAAGAASASSRAAARAAESAAESAWSAAKAAEAARAAESAAESAARAAAWASGGSAAWAATARAAWDTIARATIDAINTECDAQEEGE